MIKAYVIFEPAMVRNKNKSRILLTTIRKGPRHAINAFMCMQTQWGFETWKEAYSIGYRTKVIYIESK